MEGGGKGMSLRDGGVKAAVVIDVGCAKYGGDYSIERLIEEFNPDVLYGFDPGWDPSQVERIGTTILNITKAAAWTCDGEIDFVVAGLSGHVASETERHTVCVPCVDLAKVIEDAHREHGGPLVLKIDAEGAEYDLLAHLIATGRDRLVDLAWVEWHQPDRGRADLEELFAGEVIEWRW